ncbi:esterase/lipase family protein [Deinococcus soli (ex Cha et al. 2016)]|uniref:esterase/lipase family protein n=1 Tax=Deinococcus soli (ex Cha et al. 2016) TaxID=1309411 RepID=UPI00166AF609|nr:hypothetical protein [Deinococcus soli (ex Cha et al. 2016)]GGB70947.1 hypothetical protein GCM10008019_28920 [Deinococcus soli (ex Cha et al. 2016)]
MRRLLVTALLGLTLSTQASAQNYYLLHGLNDNRELWGTFKTWLPTSSAYAYNYDSLTQGIAQQALQVNAEVDAYTGTVTPYVLIGHSQGGLRARYYAQYIAPQTGKAQNLKGLMTIGTPHQGAPIINNGPALITRINRDVSIASIGLANVGLGLVTGNTSLQSQRALAFLFQRPQGVADLDPSSDFLKTLNNTRTVAGNCRWVSVNLIIYTRWYQICDQVPDPGNAPIPGNVVTASVVGTQNNLFNAYPEGRTYRNAAVGIGSVIAAGWSAAAFWTFGATIPMAAAGWDFVYVAANAENIWQNEVVGSTEGDFIVPKASQNIYAANPNLGGAGRYTYYVNATHTSSNPTTEEAGNNDTRAALQDFNLRLAR